MPESLHNAIVKQVKPICRMHVPPSVRPSARWPAQLSASSPSWLCYVACNKFRVEKHFNFKRNYKISPPLNCVAFLLRCALVAFWAKGCTAREAGGGCVGICTRIEMQTEQAQKAAARKCNLKATSTCRIGAVQVQYARWRRSAVSTRAKLWRIESGRERKSVGKRTNSIRGRQWVR